MTEEMPDVEIIDGAIIVNTIMKFRKKRHSVEIKVKELNSDELEEILRLIMDES